MVNSIAIIGSSGALGRALTQLYSQRYSSAKVYAFSRKPNNYDLPNVLCHAIDYHNEHSIQKAATWATTETPIDRVIVATGLLHDGEYLPEKSLRELSAEKFQRIFAANTIAPALAAKHFLPHLNRHQPAIFAALSARVGSISDNHLGGWYGYRASKAALNMVIKNAAIEIGRHNQQAIVVGLHPGTVDSQLSQPFQKNVPNGKLFTPNFAAQKLLDVLASLTPEISGQCLAWDGEIITP